MTIIAKFTWVLPFAAAVLLVSFWSEIVRFVVLHGLPVATAFAFLLLVLRSF